MKLLERVRDRSPELQSAALPDFFAITLSQMHLFQICFEVTSATFVNLFVPLYMSETNDPFFFHGMPNVSILGLS